MVRVAPQELLFRLAVDLPITVLRHHHRPGDRRVTRRGWDGGGEFLCVAVI